MISRSALTLKSPVSTSIHWNNASPVSISVGNIKNRITTFEATKFVLNSLRFDFVIRAISPNIIEITTHSKIGVIASINIFKIIGEGVNKENSEFEEKQSNENTVLVPVPIIFNGTNISLIVLGKFIL